MKRDFDVVVSGGTGRWHVSVSFMSDRGCNGRSRTDAPETLGFYMSDNIQWVRGAIMLTCVVHSQRVLSSAYRCNTIPIAT